MRGIVSYYEINFKYIRLCDVPLLIRMYLFKEYDLKLDTINSILGIAT